MATLFSTQDHGARDRFNYWHEVVCRIYAHCQGTVESRDGFIARTEVRNIGSVEISDVVSLFDETNRKPRFRPLKESLATACKTGL
jgi:hypothetical protein